MQKKYSISNCLLIKSILFFSLKIICLLLLILILFTANNSFAHGDINKRIKEITLSIKQYPDSISLYHNRGVLHTQHGDFDLAIKDFDHCSSLNYDNIYLNLDIATVYFHIKNFERATTQVNEVLCEQPSNELALQLKGEILKEQAQYVEAAKYFEDALLVAAHPKPENYIQIYNTWLLTTHAEANCKALAIIESGIEKLGPLYVFNKQLIDYHLSNGDINDAIEVQNKIITTLNRKEHAYYNLALIKIDAGLTESAINDLILAENAIEKLPSKIKTLKATEQLYQNIYQLLKVL